LRGEVNLSPVATDERRMGPRFHADGRNLLAELHVLGFRVFPSLPRLERLKRPQALEDVAVNGDTAEADGIPLAPPLWPLESPVVASLPVGLPKAKVEEAL